MTLRKEKVEWERQFGIIMKEEETLIRENSFVKHIMKADKTQCHDNLKDNKYEI